jgi:enoyl-[acyl-carrier protein] reductase II
MKNKFFTQVQEAESNSATKEELLQLLGRGRAKKGMFEGQLEEGELEIGQVSALLDEILPANEIVRASPLWRSESAWARSLAPKGRVEKTAPYEAS